MRTVREGGIEQKFVKLVKGLDARIQVLKFEPRGSTGWPDRVVLCPNGRAVFIEFKVPGAEPRPLQLHRHQTLRRLGFHVLVESSSEEALGRLRKILEAKV